jgi:LysM repeat protein
MRIKIVIAFIFLSFQLNFAQDSLEVFQGEIVIDTIVSDSILEQGYKSEIINTKAISNFYVKLKQLETKKDCKLRIVHIGDSHIQADLFTGKMRALLQERFGNGGLGFSFPYNLAKTNGNYFIKYSASTTLECSRNVFADSTKPIGLSGISMETTAKDFAIELQVRDEQYKFNTIKVVSPQNQRLIDLATASNEIKIESATPKVIYHKIKRGEALSIIANKYKVSVSAIKKANGLYSNNIRAGKVLKIPTNETEPKIISRKEFIPLTLIENENSYSYYSPTELDKIYILPAENATTFSLNGIVLENNSSGIVYSNIGVNGAKASDYNKFPMFFEQLKVLEADLIIISLGTNESFDKLETQAYFERLNQMITSIKIQNPSIEILVTTPPPSLWKRKYPNTLVEEYTQKIIENATLENYAVWNMFEALGGLQNVNKNYAKGLMARDKVHYSKAGYEQQGMLFYEALLNTYEQVKSDE